MLLFTLVYFEYTLVYLCTLEEESAAIQWVKKSVFSQFTVPPSYLGNIRDLLDTELPSEHRKTSQKYSSPVLLNTKIIIKI